MAPQVGLEPTTLRLTAECSAIELLRNMAVVVQFLLYNHLVESGSDLLSRAVSSQVPSARGGLTSVFGMGTGGTLQPLPPEILCRFQFPRRLASSRFAPRFPLHAPSRFPVFASPRYLPLSRGLRFPSDAPLSLRFRPSGPLFRTFKTAQVKLTSKHASFFSDQALDLLVPASFHVTAFTPPAYLPCRLQGVLPTYSSGSLLLVVGFTLRCLQRLSHPHFASLLCRWHDNSCTRGASIPVLSY